MCICTFNDEEGSLLTNKRIRYIRKRVVGSQDVAWVQRPHTVLNSGSRYATLSRKVPRADVTPHEAEGATK